MPAGFTNDFCHIFWTNTILGGINIKWKEKNDSNFKRLYLMNKKLSETLVRNLSGDFDNWNIFQDKVTPQTKKIKLLIQYSKCSRINIKTLFDRAFIKKLVSFHNIYSICLSTWTSNNLGKLRLNSKLINIRN